MNNIANIIDRLKPYILNKTFNYVMILKAGKILNTLSVEQFLFQPNFFKLINVKNQKNYQKITNILQIV